MARARHRARRNCAADEQFVRRVYARHHRHPADARRRSRRSSPTSDADKRDKLIDALLETPEYSYYFANHWADILRVKRGNNNNQKAGPTARSRSTTGFARASPRTSRTTSLSARSSPPSATRRRARRPCGIATCRSPSSSSMMPASSSSACAWPAPSATIIPTRSGARTITGAWPPSSAASAARPCRCPASTSQNQQQNRQVIYNKGNGNVINKRTSKPAIMKPLDGDAGRARAAATTRGSSWWTGWSMRRTRSSPGPSPIATGPTSSAEASSIRSTTCA